MHAFKLILAAFAASLFAFSSSVAKAGTSLRDDRDATLTTAADAHLTHQANHTWGGTSLCATAGNPAPSSWEWIVGTEFAYMNVQGITATGLLYAYEQLWDDAYLAGAKITGEMLVTCYDSLAGRPYSQDVEFLVKLSSLTNDKSYAGKAESYYARTIAGFLTGDLLADYYIDARKSLAGWDLASQIRAAVAVGRADYASAIAAQLIARRANWESVQYSGSDYTLISRASLLWALGELNDKLFGDFADELKAAVLGSQAFDGSWEGGDYQTTAYALLGLGTLPRRPEVQQAISDGAAYLIDTETAGGWFYDGDQYGEVNSEALTALGAVRLDNGLHEGFTDPLPNVGNDHHPAEPAS